MRGFVVLSCFLVLCAAVDYEADRKLLIDVSLRRSIGYELQLTPNEIEADDIFLSLKYAELDEGFVNPKKFLVAQHFYEVRHNITESEVFKFIKKVPKGTALHAHDLFMVSGDFFFNMTYKYADNLYVLDNPPNDIRVGFFNAGEQPSSWVLISSARENSSTFDVRLRSQLTLVVWNPKLVYNDTDDVWNRFRSTFPSTIPLITYQPIFKDCFYQALKELYEDNVKYLEFRGLFPQLYDLNNTAYDKDTLMQLYIDTTQEFINDFPDFWGTRFIYGPSRNVNQSVVQQYIDDFLELQAKFPDFVVGFDLTDQEDKGRPLADFIPQLQQLQNKTNFFFHAGESDWFGEPTDENLFDAILLGTKRIGHGFALIKYTLLMEMVKEKGIAIELSPISNLIGILVNEARNHPGTYYIANNLPVVICHDDPTIWGTKGVNYDWYVAFMGMTHRDNGLGTLKQLAINSIQYSAMTDDQKSVAMNKWQADWDQFIQEVLAEDNQLVIV
ncbi:adenosine deaminase 2-A-like [Cylas formicarius]|uniref:adenosine deaminase 2-A-like n=1 Tax=Cylas formicarius TaxID=197179 RepID=UPI0029587571|nr:adenosine deaminase 2-A-like [Cylas formicarius]